MLSRATHDKPEIDAEMSEMVHSVRKHLPMSDERQRLLRMTTSKDLTLMLISTYF